MRPQTFGWTCAACALDWVLKSTGLVAPSHTRLETILQIGYPENINPTWGLMDASGPALREVYASYDQDTQQAWLGFDDVYMMAQETTGQMSGAAWYHWVALRGVTGNSIWLANSAPGYKGIFDVLNRADFERLGPFSVVLLK